MTEDKSIKENLKFLDNILDNLTQISASYVISFKDLYRAFYNRDLDTDNNWNALNYLNSINENGLSLFSNLADNTKAQGEKLVEALYYLQQENYISLDHQFNIKITFRGIIQNSKTFLGEYKKDIREKLFNKWNTIITLIISIISFIAGLLVDGC